MILEMIYRVVGLGIIKQNPLLRECLEVPSLELITNQLFSEGEGEISNSRANYGSKLSCIP
jgi:hypothetical protein